MANEKNEAKGAVVEPLLTKSENTGSEIVTNEKSNLQDKKGLTQVKRIKSVAIIETKDARQRTKLVPPDGGWGWLVLFGATLVNVLVPGMIKSFGVLFVEFLEVFQPRPAVAMMIPSLCYFLYSSLGPVSSILSLKYSYRTVTFIGGTFAAVGMMTTFFAQSIVHLYITFGLLVGIGAGLSFPPTVYIVTGYFLRLRGLANGVCISGSALGSIFLPPILRILLEYYGYRGAVLLMGGLTLNCWVAALFYDPVEKHMKRVPIESSIENEETDAFTPKFIISNEESNASLNRIPLNDSFADVDLSSNHFNRSVSSAAMQNFKVPHRERKISMPAGKSGGALRSVPEQGRPDAMEIISHSKLRRRSGLPRRSPSTSSFQYVTTPYHGSTLTLQPETFASSFSLRGSTGKLSKDGSSPKRKFLDPSLLKDPLFLIILTSNAINAISYTNFIILLPAYASSVNFDKNQGALLLSIVSGFDLVGRIGGSALSDLQLCPKLVYFIGGLLVSGIALTILALYPSYIFISTCCAIFGLFSGTYTGITAVVMTDMLGEERLQATYGISLFVNGILQFVSPPACGAWYAAMNSYKSLFCCLGVLLIIGAAVWIFLPFIEKKQNKDDDEPESP